ncbi:MAG TPA: precorrin-6y C5,15-methyltransferase (decarboxylating) subunit CbiE, partial [Rhizobiales bacterium]|nr:precorrin-6y C5,15-methyltransferase (decarboxylating) subunit CbiE [Hyphomicrobiales bacterium]
MSHDPWLTIVGIGEDGWEGLSQAARSAVLEADMVIGGKRHLAMIPRHENTQSWPSPIKSYLDRVLSRKGKSTCVLASGDPMFYGVGARLARLVPRNEIRIFTHLSAYALICAAMGWSEPDSVLVTACGRPVEQLNAALFDGTRIVFYSADETTPGKAVALLRKRGFGNSKITLFENVG